MVRTAPEGPARRRRLSEAERRGQIIRGCAEVLATEGYRAASLARIAEAAGVSKGLVSHYFTDRDDLLEQTALTTLVEVREGVAAQLDLSRPVPEILRAAVHHAASLPRTHAAQLRVLDQVNHNLTREDGLPRLTHDSYEETYRAQETLFRRGQEEGSLRSFDTRVMAVTYQGAIDAMLGYLAAHPDVDPSAYADRLVDLLLAVTAQES